MSSRRARYTFCPVKTTVRIKSLQIVVNPPDLMVLKIDAQDEMPKVLDTQCCCFSSMPHQQSCSYSFGLLVSSLEPYLCVADCV